MNGIIVGWSVNIADNTKGNGETILGSHHGELQLQGVVLAVSIVNQYIVDGVTVLADLNHLKAEALLYQSELIVLAEYELLAVLYVDGVLLTTFIVVNYIMAVVIEDYTVLQNLSYAGTLVLVGCLQHLNSSLCIGSHAASKEVSACTKAEFCWAEWILYSAVRARLRNKSTW